MFRYDFYTGWYLPSNVTIANVILRGFDLIFQGQIFQLQIFIKWLAKHASYGLYRLWYLPLNGAIPKVVLPLNGAIPKVVLCDVSLLVQDQISKCSFLESGASCANMSNTTFMDVDICHQNRTIAQIILCDPDSQFRGQNCKYSLKCFSRFASTCTAPAVELLLFRSSSLARIMFTNNDDDLFKCDKFYFMKRDDQTPEENRQAFWQMSVWRVLLPLLWNVSIQQSNDEVTEVVLSWLNNWTLYSLTRTNVMLTRIRHSAEDSRSLSNMRYMLRLYGEAIRTVTRHSKGSGSQWRRKQYKGVQWFKGSRQTCFYICLHHSTQAKSKLRIFCDWNVNNAVNTTPIVTILL